MATWVAWRGGLGVRAPQSPFHLQDLGPGGAGSGAGNTDPVRLLIQDMCMPGCFRGGGRFVTMGKSHS